VGARERQVPAPAPLNVNLKNCNVLGVFLQRLKPFFLSCFWHAWRHDL